MLSSSCDDQASVYSRSLALIPSKDANYSSKASIDSGKYVRYTAEQVQALERLYNECPKPSSLRRQQLIRENPILQNIEAKQIKVWFQNRRCREKQRKESSRLQSVNSKLTAMNRLLMEENDRLQRQAAQLLYENGCLRQQLQHGGITTDTSCDSVVTSGLQHLPTSQQSPQDATYSGILSLAEETLAEFLGKATGTAVDWVQIHGMKPGPDSTEVINISHGCAGVAARACGLVSMEAARIVEVLKDKASWHRNCRRMTTMFATSTASGGCIEVLYTQTYAPTTLAPGRDFYTLRYSSPLDDGSFIVCERSMNALRVAPVAPQMQPFIRAEMQASGCLIKPCDSTSCIVIVVDHADLEPLTVPEVLRPLYESPAVLAHNITIPALRQLRYLAQERMSEAPGGAQQPAAVRSLSYRLAKGFNDAINTFADDGWAATTCDRADDVTIMVKFPASSRDLGVQLQSTQKGIMCAKASMLLQNVPPSLLVRFLREHRSEWADTGLEEAMRMGNPGLYGFHNGMNNSQVLSPHNIHATEHDEFLELIKMEGCEGPNSLTGTQEVFLLQLCSGLEEGGVGAGAQMVFAPIDASISDDVELMPSGFRVLPLDNNGSDERNGASSRTLDLASALEVGGATGLKSSSSKDMEDKSLGMMKMRRSVLSMAFQFNFEGGMEDSVVRMAILYVRHVVSTLHRLALALTPPLPPSLPLPPINSSSCHHQNAALGLDSPGSFSHDDLHLAQWICRSYKMNVGMDLLQVEVEKTQDHMKALWKLKDAIFCCTCKVVPVFTFANQAGLEMLEVSSSAQLQETSCSKTILDDESNKGSMQSVIAQVMQQGYACLPGGLKVSSKGRVVSYEQAIAWKVVMQVEEELAVHGVAFLFTNWSFLHCSSSGSSIINSSSSMINSSVIMKLGDADNHLLPAALLLS